MTDDLRIEVSGLTELERLELEEIIGEKLAVVPQSTPAGHLGEPGTLTAIVQISQVAIPTIGTCLAIFLAKGRDKVRIKDNIDVTTKNGSFRRKLNIVADKEDAVKADVIRQLGEAAMSIRREATANDDSGN